MKELITIQSTLKAPKNQFNKFGNYKYRSLEDIFEAVKPLLLKHKCHLVVSDKAIDLCSNATIEATATLTNSEGISISNTGFAGVHVNKKGMDVPQTFGTASSYARKYALAGLFLLDDTKDSDTSEHHEESKKSTKEEKKKLTKDQLSDFHATMQEDNLWQYLEPDEIEKLKKYRDPSYAINLRELALKRSENGGV